MLWFHGDEQDAWQSLELTDNKEASYHGLSGGWRTLPLVEDLCTKHIRALKSCFTDSLARARRDLVIRFASLELNTVIDVLFDAIKQMLLVYAGSMSVGAVVGAVASGGVGVALGAAAGAELATFALGLIGLKCLAELFIQRTQSAFMDYRVGLCQAWEAVHYDRRGERVVVDQFKLDTATADLARAHVDLVTALLLAIVAYLSKGQVKSLVVEARTGKLGNRFADWLEHHGDTLKDHPWLQPRPAATPRPQPTKPMLVPRTQSAAEPTPEGLHNQKWQKVYVPRETFKTRRTVDMENLSAEDAAVKSALKKQGWRREEKIKEILETGDSFKLKELQPGDKLYGFNTAGVGKDINKSAYWLDESNYQDVQSKFCQDGVWDKEGVKNYLALPCYNRADAIDLAEVTQPTTVVEAKIGKATELIQYTDDSGYTTGLLGKIMPGGGNQVTASPSVLKAVSGVQ